MNKPKTVEQYLAAITEPARSKLEQLREIVQKLAPEAEERISYGMPGYFYNGPLVYIGAFKDHVSLFGAGNSLQVKFKEALTPYKTSKGTIQFPLNEKLPIKLIEAMILERVKENKQQK